MSKHPHAESMALYAQDAMETDKPWLRWQLKFPNELAWNDLGDDTAIPGPNWLAGVEYRRKPRTITINGIEVPEPMRDEPEKGARVWTVTLHHDTPGTDWVWGGDPSDQRWLARGLCHTTREAAELHARALLSFTERKA